MSNKTKFKLEALKVESFSTQLQDEKKEQVKGGVCTRFGTGCAVTDGCIITITNGPIYCCPVTDDC